MPNGHLIDLERESHKNEVNKINAHGDLVTKFSMNEMRRFFFIMLLSTFPKDFLLLLNSLNSFCIRICLSVMSVSKLATNTTNLYCAVKNLELCPILFRFSNSETNVICKAITAI